MACFAQRDPIAALERGHHGYIYGQSYSRHPGPSEVTRVMSRLVDDLLGLTGVDEVLDHAWAKLHVITAMGWGLAASSQRVALGVSMAIAAVGNLISRRTLALQLKRCVFNSAGSDTPFLHLSDLPTTL